MLVTVSPASGHGARTAAGFAQQLLARGHTIHRVFFLDAGTETGSDTAVFPQDEPSRLAPWLELHHAHNVELVLCISSAIKRGMLDNTEAQRYEKPSATVHPAFIISGLGQLVDGSLHSDRLVSFGG